MQHSKAIDERFSYCGENGLMAHCRVRVYAGKDLAPVVIASECDDNPGQSVTNAAQTLWPKLIARYLPGWLDQAEDLTLIEHYPGRRGEWGRRQVDTFDRVTFSSWRPLIRHLTAGRFVSFGDPEWKHLGEQRVAEMVGTIE